jgi:hypothetical protein
MQFVLAAGVRAAVTLELAAVVVLAVFLLAGLLLLQLAQ